jgi:hypothetical protein
MTPCPYSTITQTREGVFRRSAPKLLVVLFVCALAIAVEAQTASSVHVNYKETMLKNGLRVITAEVHSAPVIAIAVNYNVGSRNERQGRTGFAHLFEHMNLKIVNRESRFTTLRRAV